MRLDIYFHTEHVQNRDLAEIKALLKTIITKENQMAGELDALKVDVQESIDVQQSAIIALAGIKAALDAAIASGDPAALAALSASLDSTKDALAAAIVANTPAAP